MDWFSNVLLVEIKFFSPPPRVIRDISVSWGSKTLFSQLPGINTVPMMLSVSKVTAWPAGIVTKKYICIRIDPHRSNWLAIEIKWFPRSCMIRTNLKAWTIIWAEEINGTRVISSSRSFMLDGPNWTVASWRRKICRIAFLNLVNLITDFNCTVNITSTHSVFKSLTTWKGLLNGRIGLGCAKVYVIFIDIKGRHSTYSAAFLLSVSKLTAVWSNWVPVVPNIKTVSSHWWTSHFF